VTQPSFAPVPQAGAVRPVASTPAAELGRVAKKGLLRHPQASRGPGAGTPAPGEGFALTIAEHVLNTVTFAHEHDRHDVVLGVALVAAKRASLVGRGPTKGDVDVALAHLSLTGETISAEAARPFAGLGHSYVAQRRFVDAVSSVDLGL